MPLQKPKSVRFRKLKRFLKTRRTQPKRIQFTLKQRLHLLNSLLQTMLVSFAP